MELQITAFLMLSQIQRILILTQNVLLHMVNSAPIVINFQMHWRKQAKILLQSSGLPNERKAEVEYDCNNSIKSIENWKAHILMTINQESAKQEILESLDHQTAFIVIDFAMKILARSYRESMAHWFGKAGMGMHVSCVVIKKAEGRNEESFKKRTYYNIYW